MTQATASMIEFAAERGYTMDAATGVLYDGRWPVSPGQLQAALYSPEQAALAERLSIEKWTALSAFALGSGAATEGGFVEESRAAGF